MAATLHVRFLNQHSAISNQHYQTKIRNILSASNRSLIASDVANLCLVLLIADGCVLIEDATYPTVDLS